MSPVPPPSPRQRLQVAGQVDQPGDVPVDHIHHARAPGGVFDAVGRLQQRHRVLQRAERLAQFVADHPIERVEPLGVLFDRTGVFGDERIHGRLKKHTDAVVQALKHPDALSRFHIEGETLGFLANERGQDAAEDAVFLRHLVDGRALCMPKLSEFLRLGDDPGVGRNRLFFRGADVARHLPNQLGDWSSSASVGNTSLLSCRNQLGEPVQPSARY